MKISSLVEFFCVIYLMFFSFYLNAQSVSKIKTAKGKGIYYHGENYETIILGNGQEWMAQNLKTTQYNDGTSIPLVTDSLQWVVNSSKELPMMCWYGNDQTTYSSSNFGSLYNLYAISPNTNGNRNVCPAGWHVPSDKDWTKLINYLDSKADGGYNRNMAGGKMKSIGTQYWKSPNSGASNESGFNGLPGGFRNYDGNFFSFGKTANWWSYKELTTFAWAFSLNFEDQEISKVSMNLGNAYSVRCIKD